MKKSLTLTLALCGAGLLLAACGPKTETTAAAATAPATPVAAKSAASTFEFTANDTMKFNLKTFEVAAGREITVSMTNTGNMPKAAMGHNWVLLKKGVDAKAFADAAVMAMGTEYIPASKADQIIVHTKLLGPKQSDEVKFKAPTEPGEYVFLCTFPAHFASGMQGVMIVK
jgi:azurin